MRLIKNLFILLIIITICSCGANEDDGSTATGYLDEYFKYRVDGVERVFDYEVEGHLETETNSTTHRFEINASGVQAVEGRRRVGISFVFNSMDGFMPGTNYNWGMIPDSNPETKFYFLEITSNYLFIIEADFSVNPIVATLQSTVPINVGDYMEFTFFGTFQDDNHITRTISGECRVKRDADQNF
ncbi:MAG: hypothetical protein ABI295_03835 [Xanthomarina sp.]